LRLSIEFSCLFFSPFERSQPDPVERRRLLTASRIFSLVFSFSAAEICRIVDAQGSLSHRKSDHLL